MIANIKNIGTPKDRALSKKAAKAFKITTHKNPNKFVLALMPWQENAPTALPIGKGGWGDWRKSNEKKYPIRYFFFYTIPDEIGMFFRYSIIRPIKDAKWALLHRFHPKHRYNILKPRSLKPGYYDSDMRILHACMDELSEFVEWNKKNNWIEWSGDEKHQHAWSEMMAIYKWWNKDRAVVEKNSDKMLSKWHTAFNRDGGFDAKTRSKKTNKLSDEHQRLEELVHSTDETMLIRLMKIRRFMWT